MEHVTNWDRLEEDLGRKGRKTASAAALAVALAVLAAPLAAAEIEIRGRLLDAAGRAVEGAEVEIVPLPDRAGTGRLQLAGRYPPAAASAVRSRDDGTFAIAAPSPGMWRLLVRHRDHLPMDRLLRPLLQPLDVGDRELIRGTAQPLLVVDAEGRGVAGLRLDVRGQNRRQLYPWRVADRTLATGEDGRAILLRPPEGVASLAAIVGESFVYGELGEGRSPAILTLAPLRRARVVDPEGRPVAGAVGSFRSPSLAFGRSGPEGEILLPYVAEDGPTLYFATAEGLAEGRLEGSGEGEELVARLGATVAATGRVTDARSGRGVPGAYVWTWHTYRQTGPDGGFHLRLAERDSLRAAAVGYFPSSVPREQLGVRDLAVALSPVISLRGGVFDAEGQGLGRAKVHAQPDRRQLAVARTLTRGNELTAWSGPEGRFQLDGVVPAIPYSLRVHRSGYAPSYLTIPPVDPERPPEDLRIVLERGRRVVGRVLDADERPIAGVEVRLMPSGYLLRERISTAVIDAAGRFEVADLAPGSYRLAAVAPGFARRELDGIEVPPAGSPAAGSPAAGDAVDVGTVVLEPAWALSGRVTDAEGEPIPEAGIRLRVRNEWRELDPTGRLRETRTDAEGLFVISELSPADELQLEVAKNGYQKLDFFPVRIQRQEPLELVLSPGIDLRGRAVDAARRPVAGAAVTLIQERRRYRADPVETDSEGRFVFSAQAPGPFTLQARSRDGLAGSLEGELVPGAEELVLVLGSAARISGRLLDPEGTGVTGAQINAERYRPGEVDSRDREIGTARARTGGGGSFALAGLEPGAYRLSVRQAGFEPLTEILELADGEVRELELSFRARRPPVLIRGRVVDESGDGVADVSMRLFESGWHRGYAVSAADGGFLFQVERPGLHTLRLEHDDFARRDVEIEVAEDGDEVVVELTRGGTIYGRLLGFEPGELARLDVRAYSERPPWVSGVVTPDGGYRLSGLQAGDWRIFARLDGSGRFAEGTVTVSGPGDERVLDLEVVPGHRLSGLVLFDGNPLAAADVALRCRYAGELSERTRADGTFLFDDVPAGLCSLVVHSRESPMEHVRSVDVAGDQEVTVELASAALAGIVVRASDSEIVAGATVELLGLHRRDVRQSATTDELGVFTFPSVVEGSARLRVVAEGYAMTEQQVALRSGANDTRLVLTPTVPVVLQVLTLDGAIPRRVTVSPGRRQGSELFYFQRTFQPDREGRIVLHGLGAGGWELHLRDEEGRSATVEVEVPGAPAQVVLEFRRPN